MKIKTFMIPLVLVTGFVMLGSSDNFLDNAVQDQEARAQLLGKWAVYDSRYTFEYTDDFAQRYSGFVFYIYRTSQRPKSDEYIYTVLKSKKTGRKYLCRGIWRRGRMLTVTTSRMIVKGNRLQVYEKHNPKAIYFSAERVQDNLTSQKE